MKKKTYFCGALNSWLLGDFWVNYVRNVTNGGKRKKKNSLSLESTRPACRGNHRHVFLCGLLVSSFTDVLVDAALELDDNSSSSEVKPHHHAPADTQTGFELELLHGGIFLSLCEGAACFKFSAHI